MEKNKELTHFPRLVYLEKVAFWDYFKQIEYHFERVMGRTENVTVGDYIKEMESLREERKSGGISHETDKYISFF